jgi:hypothetical protein
VANPLHETVLLAHRHAAENSLVVGKAAQRDVDATRNLPRSNRQKLLDGIAVLFDIIEKMRRADT